jgi:hypothetical protein
MLRTSLRLWHLTLRVSGGQKHASVLAVRSTGLILIEAPSSAYPWYAIVEDGNEERRRRLEIFPPPFHAVLVANGLRVLPLARAWH